MLRLPKWSVAVYPSKFHTYVLLTVPNIEVLRKIGCPMLVLVCCGNKYKLLSLSIQPMFSAWKIKLTSLWELLKKLSQFFPSDKLHLFSKFTTNYGFRQFFFECDIFSTHHWNQCFGLKKCCIKVSFPFFVLHALIPSIPWYTKNLTLLKRTRHSFLSVQLQTSFLHGLRFLEQFLS